MRILHCVDCNYRWAVPSEIPPLTVEAARKPVELPEINHEDALCLDCEERRAERRYARWYEQWDAWRPAHYRAP